MYMFTKVPCAHWGNGSLFLFLSFSINKIYVNIFVITVDTYLLINCTALSVVAFIIHSYMFILMLYNYTKKKCLWFFLLFSSFFQFFSIFSPLERFLPKISSMFKNK